MALLDSLGLDQIKNPFASNSQEFSNFYETFYIYKETNQDKRQFETPKRREKLSIEDLKFNYRN